MNYDPINVLTVIGIIISLALLFIFLNYRKKQKEMRKKRIEKGLPEYPFKYKKRHSLARNFHNYIWYKAMNEKYRYPDDEQEFIEQMTPLFLKEFTNIALHGSGKYIRKESEELLEIIKEAFHTLQTE